VCENEIEVFSEKTLVFSTTNIEMSKTDQ